MKERTNHSSRLGRQVCSRGGRGREESGQSASNQSLKTVKSQSVENRLSRNVDPNSPVLQAIHNWSVCVRTLESFTRKMQ